MQDLKAENPEFFIKILEVTRVLPKKPLRTTSDTCTIGWKPLLYSW